MYKFYIDHCFPSMYIEKRNLFRTHKVITKNKDHPFLLKKIAKYRYNSGHYLFIAYFLDDIFCSGSATHMKSAEIDFKKYDKILASNIWPLSQFLNFVANAFPMWSHFQKGWCFLLKTSLCYLIQTFKYFHLNKVC